MAVADVKREKIPREQHGGDYISEESAMTADDNTSNVRFGESTMIIRYFQHQKVNYDNHRKVMTELYAKRLFPRVTMYFLKKTSHEMKFDFLVIRTGPREEFLRRPAISDLRTAIETVIPGKTFADIHGDGSVADTADPGEYITSMSEFDTLRSAIERGAYSIEDTLEYV